MPGLNDIFSTERSTSGVGLQIEYADVVRALLAAYDHHKGVRSILDKAAGRIAAMRLRHVRHLGPLGAVDIVHQVSVDC